MRFTESDARPDAFSSRSPGEGGGSVLGAASGPLARDIPIGNTPPPSMESEQHWLGAEKGRSAGTAC